MIVSEELRKRSADAFEKVVDIRNTLYYWLEHPDMDDIENTDRLCDLYERVQKLFTDLAMVDCCVNRILSHLRSIQEKEREETKGGCTSPYYVPDDGTTTGLCMSETISITD